MDLIPLVNVTNFILQFYIKTEQPSYNLLNELLIVIVFLLFQR